MPSEKDSDPDFREYRRLILSQLERHDEVLHAISTKHDGLVQAKVDAPKHDALEVRVRGLEADLRSLQERLAVYVTVGAALVSILVTVAFKLLRV